MATVSSKSNVGAPLDNDALYEVVNGQRVELPPMGAYETLIASALLCYLHPFCHKRKLGRAVNEMLFDLARIGQQRRPDVAFVSYKRSPDGHEFVVVEQHVHKVLTRANVRIGSGGQCCRTAR